MFQTQGSAFNAQELRIRDFLSPTLKTKMGLAYSCSRLPGFELNCKPGKTAGLMPFDS
jgi:hypothetical protein